MCYLRDHSSIRNQELRKLTGIDYDQAIFFFNRMILENRLRRIGVTSGIRYILPND